MVRHLFFILFVLGCGRAGDSPRTLANLPGEDSGSALILGQGYHQVSNQAKGHCVDLGPLQTQNQGDAGGQISSFRFVEITSESQLKESLGISASASFGDIIGQQSGRLSFIKDIRKHQESRYLLIHTRVANQLRLASSFKYRPEFVELLRKGDFSKFVDHCGTEFVYGTRTGGEFFAVAEFSKLTSAEDQAFTAAVKAAGLGWKAEGELNHALSIFWQFSLSQIRMLRIGGHGEFPKVTDLGEFARKFPQMVTDLRGSPVTLELITKDYTGVSPVDLPDPTPAYAQQMYALTKLALLRDQAWELLNSVQYVKRHQSDYEAFDSNYIEKQLTHYINAVQLAALDCMREPGSACPIPELSLPVVILPNRKLAAGSTRLSTDLWHFDYPAQAGYLQNDRNAWHAMPLLAVKYTDAQITKVGFQLEEVSCQTMRDKMKNLRQIRILTLGEKTLSVYERSFKESDGFRSNVTIGIDHRGCALVYFYNVIPTTEPLSLFGSSEFTVTAKMILASLNLTKL
jgi:hypothetical protein